MPRDLARTLLFISSLLAAACGSPAPLPSNLPTATTQAPIIVMSSTPYPANTAPPIVSPTARPSTPPALITTLTATSTPVPLGVFALTVFYMPLIMNYDPAVWSDESHYSDLSVWINQLRARGLATCTLGPEGPNGNFPTPDHVVQLGLIRYQVTVAKDQTFGSVIAYYIDTNSLPQFDYQTRGVVKLDFTARASEWDACRRLAETVLSTLHWPS